MIQKILTLKLQSNKIEIDRNCKRGYAMVKAKGEVEKYLCEVQELVKQSFENLKIQKKTEGKDKTRTFMNEYGIKHSVVCRQILMLDITNYCYTDDDKGDGRVEEVWIFGQMMEAAHNDYKEIYIKLKMIGKVLCLSFHPKERDLEYPYN